MRAGSCGEHRRRCSGAHRLHRSDGTPVHHHLGVSAFADYATVSRRSLVKIDPELPFEEVALFGCAVLTGVGAVVNTAQVPAGSAVAVVGLGGVGLSSLLGAVAAGRVRWWPSTCPTRSSTSPATSVRP